MAPRSCAADPSARDPRRRALGVVMVLMGGVCLSTSGVLLRNVEFAGGWQILFYRGLFFALTIGLFLACRHRRRVFTAFLGIGRPGLFVGVILGLASVLYIFGILSTTVANVVFIISAAPLVTAVFARIFLGEHPGSGTWLAMTAAIGGVALMVGDGLLGGGLFGVLCALGVAVAFAAMLTTMRGNPGVDMLPALCLSGVVSAGIASMMAPGLGISLHDMTICFLLGTVQFGGGFVLITLGVRYVPAAEAALLSLTETVLAPLWVWLAIDEAPTRFTLIGGIVVIAAVSSRALYTARADRIPGA